MVKLAESLVILLDGATTATSNLCVCVYIYILYIYIYGIPVIELVMLSWLK